MAAAPKAERQSREVHPFRSADSVSFLSALPPPPSRPAQVDRKKDACKPRCGACKRAWKSTPTNRTVAVFFKDPVQITGMSIKQVKNPNIVLVRIASC